MSRTQGRYECNRGGGPCPFHFCPYCGDRLRPHESNTAAARGEADPGERFSAADCLPPRDEAKSPALAALLSFLLVGMGQVYLGQVEKGLVLLCAVLLLLLTARPGAAGLLILLLNVLDAFLLARRLGRGERVGRWEFFFHPGAGARRRRGP